VLEHEARVVAAAAVEQQQLRVVLVVRQPAQMSEYQALKWLAQKVWAGLGLLSSAATAVAIVGAAASAVGAVVLKPALAEVEEPLKARMQQRAAASAHPALTGGFIPTFGGLKVGLMEACRLGSGATAAKLHRALGRPRYRWIAGCFSVPPRQSSRAPRAAG
jgi:hypothetical protein